MAALSSLYSSVRLSAPQCPDATIDKYLIESIREFCRESRYYQQTLSINQVSGTASYTITPANSEEVIAVDFVQQEDADLYPININDIETDGVTPTGYAFEPPSTITISPTPTETVASGLEVRVVVMPPESTTTIPDSIYRNYKETIAAGALRYILAMPNEAWSNPSLISLKTKEFWIGVFAAKGERARGFRTGNLTVKPRSFLI